MPRIQEYTAENTALRPTEEGVSAFAYAGRRVGAFYNQAGEAMARGVAAVGRAYSGLGKAVGEAVEQGEQAVAHQEISHGAATFAQSQDDMIQQWNSTVQNADPNDTSVKAKFFEQTFEPWADQYIRAFNTPHGQDWATDHIDHLRNHMVEKTSADMATMAGVAVKTNIEKSENSWTNSAFTDPASVPYLLDSAKKSIDGLVESSPNLKGTAAAAVKTEVLQRANEHITRAGAYGAITKAADPEAEADKWIKQYPDLIKGDEAKQFAAFARQQIHARNFDYEMNRRRAKEEAQDRSNELTNQYLIDVRSKDPKLVNDPTAQKILNDPHLLKADKNNLLNYIDRQVKPETDARISHQTFVDLLREMRTDGADTDKLMQRAWDARLTDPGKPGSITESDFNAFRKEMVDRKTPEGEALTRDRDFFFKRFQVQFDPNMGMDARTAAGSYFAEMDARKQEAALKAKGIDPSELYRPGSEHFFGTPENIAKYKQPLQQLLQQTNAPPIPQPLRGIAALEYSPSRKQYRDQMTGKIYDQNGVEIRAPERPQVPVR